jgi:heat shock protein HslJ
MNKIVLFTGLAVMLVLASACDLLPTPETELPPPEEVAAEPPATEAPAGPEPAQMPAQVSVDRIQNTVWQWTDLVETSPAAQSVVPDPDDYLVVFRPDGSAEIKADCNVVGASYAVEGTSMNIQLGPTTMAFCGEDSLDQQYLALLGSVDSFGIEGERLILGLRDDAGRMGLVEGGAARGASAAGANAQELLVGRIWSLTQLNGQPTAPGTTITAEFGADGQVSGSGGCNGYGAVYTVQGQTIDIGPIASTMMACAQPVMQQETDYFGALEAAATFQVSPDQLTLADAGGNAIAVYAVESQGLAGTSWEVISYNNGKQGVVSVIIGTEVTAEFDEDGQLTGTAGCNRYSAAYQIEGNDISVGPATTTRMMCQEPPGIMEQEQQYLAALESAATYRIDGPTMQMRTADNATAVNFRRAEGKPPDEEGAAPPAEELALDPSQISLDTQGLPYSWQATVVPATPYDASQPPGPVGMPTHIEIHFAAGTVRMPDDPIMYIIPVNSYRKMWNDAGNPSVTQTMEEIQRLNFVLHSPAPTSGYPVLPYEEVAGTNDLAVQVGKAVSQAELNTSSATQDGYRFVGRWAQDANPVTNQGLRYVYQGFTNDGVYLVSFWYPVTTPALPDDVSQVSSEQMAQFNADSAAYLEAVATQLNGLSTDQWVPDLATLDAMVASLQIEGMTASGLLDKTWQWTQGPVQPGSAEVVSVPDPSLYQVTYGSDGTMTWVADCNRGSTSFELKNAGMTGGMLPGLGMSTLAECGPDSLSQGFVNALSAAQDYRVWAGGQELELVLPAGGGVLLLRDADAPAP